jgi:hypothetical protein
MKKKQSNTEQTGDKIYSSLNVGFRVHTMELLTEIADCGLPRSMGVLKIPLNVFKNILAEVAQRATELNDPQLNILMLKLALYEIPMKEIPKAIEHQMMLQDSQKKDKLSKQ